MNNFFIFKDNNLILLVNSTQLLKIEKSNLNNQTFDRFDDEEHFKKFLEFVEKRHKMEMN